MIRQVIGTLCFLLFIPLISCSSSGTEKDSQIISTHNKPKILKIEVDGIERRFAIFVPDNTENRLLPIVFELHGGGVYIEDMLGETGKKSPYKLWMELAEQEKFIVVYPEGLNGRYGKPTWNDCRGDCMVSSEADDVGFIEALIEFLSSKYPVDKKRVYVSGTSNGGFMALRLAVTIPEKIAAVASVAAAMPAVPSCNYVQKPISVLFMNGTDDNHMPYNGGVLGNPPEAERGTVLSTEESVNYWVELDQTEREPEYYVFNDLDPDDGGIVEKFSYRNGVEGTEVDLYRINGGGHSAPSIRERFSSLYEMYFNKQNHDIEMTEQVWNFFKNKSLK